MAKSFIDVVKDSPRTYSPAYMQKKLLLKLEKLFLHPALLDQK